MSVPPSFTAPAAVADSTRLERYLQFLARKWWLPVLMIALGAGAQFLYLLDVPPTYDSYARLMLGGRVKLPESFSFSEDYLNYFGTQIELLQSEKIRERTLARLKVQHPELKESPIKLQATQIRRSSIILLRAFGPDPGFTRAFLDALVDEYLSFKREMRTVASDDTLASLTGKLLEQEKLLNSEQEKLHLFKRDNNLSLLQEVNSAAGIYLARLKTQLSELRMEESVLKPLDTEQTLPAPVQTDGIKAAMATTNSNQNLPSDYFGARQQVQLMKFQRDELGQFMRPEHPKIIKLNDDIVRMEKLLEIYRDQGQQQRVSSLDSLRLRISALEDTGKEWEAKVVDSNTRMADFDKIKNAVARSQALYDQLLRLLQNVDVNKNIDQENMTVVERATLPLEQGRLVFQMAVAGGVGLFLGLGLLVIWERRDDRLFSLTEFKQQFEESIIGQIPQVRTGWGKGAVVLSSQMEVHSMFTESFRHIHSSLVLGSQPRALLVTSAFSTEGKSTVAANLALAAAASGTRVLLVDADVYHGHLNEWFEMPAAPGLAEAHGSKTSLSLAIAKTKIENLSLLPCGQRMGADAAFLNSPMIAELARLRQEFDLVIIDSAPVFAGDDAMRLAQSVDGVVFVVRSGVSRAGATTRALEQLYQRRAKVLGFVLNGVDGSVDHCQRYREREYRKLTSG